jgi:hypothetical protein
MSESTASVVQTLISEVRQYQALKDEVDLANKRKDEVKGRIFSATENYGEVTDKGHYVIDINDSLTGIKSVVKQRRAAKSFNPDAADTLLSSKGLREKCVKTVEILDEDAIMSAYYEGLLTDEDIDTMFPDKVTWALILEKA